MGLSVEDQRKAREFRQEINAETDELNHKNQNPTNETVTINGTSSETATCCQGITTSSCCQNEAFNGKSDNHNAILNVQKSQKSPPQKTSKESKLSCSARKMSTFPTWFESWEREDSYAALAVVTAIASVAIAYSCYRQLR